MSTSPDNNQEPAPAFEESLAALQRIVADLEGGSITLDQSLQRFEEGVGLLRQCYQFLERAEQRIEQLVSLDAQGNLTLAPFDATSTVEKQARPPAKPAARRGSRAKEPEPETTVQESNADGDDVAGKLLF